MKTESLPAYYRNMIASTLETVVARTLRHPPDRAFIDTKFSVLTGEDFAQEDVLRGPRTLYMWIQGRGMEALAAHDDWLRTCDGMAPERREALRADIRRILRRVMARMEALRARNGGRIYFMMSAEGTPLTVDPARGVVPLDVSGREPSNMSELFYVKGLAAAAALLGKAEKLDEACEWYRRIHDDIMTHRFTNDQQCLDPKNLAVKPVPGRRSHGPKMIALGAAFRFLELRPDPQWRAFGLDYLGYIIDNHVNLPGAGKHAAAPDYAFWEFVDEAFRPWEDDRQRLLSDPGHALEFVGLGFKVLETAERMLPGGIEPARQSALATVLRGVLLNNFERAFSPRGFGIRKLIDLKTGQPVNSDLPWWNLPETMRAASLAAVDDEANRVAYLAIVDRCSTAFREHYVLPERNLFAYQTLDAEGRPVDVIPGTPDADACYHTNLSLMDMLRSGVV